MPGRQPTGLVCSGLGCQRLKNIPITANNNNMPIATSVIAIQFDFIFTPPNYFHNNHVLIESQD